MSERRCARCLRCFIIPSGNLTYPTIKLRLHEKDQTLFSETMNSLDRFRVLGRNVCPYWRGWGQNLAEELLSKEQFCQLVTKLGAKLSLSYALKMLLAQVGSRHVWVLVFMTSVVHLLSKSLFKLRARSAPSQTKSQPWEDRIMEVNRSTHAFKVTSLYGSKIP